MRRLVAFPLLAIALSTVSCAKSDAKSDKKAAIPASPATTEKSATSAPVAAKSPDVTETATDTPKRVNGRIDPTEAPPTKTFDSEEERLEHIVKLLRRDEEMVAMYKPPVIFCKRVPDGSIKIDGK